jgi:hypothetical protein
VERKLALGESLLQSVDELAAKDPSQDLAGKKEAATGTDPAGVVGGKSSGSNDAMDMGMGLQLLTPGMQHAEEADLGPEMSRRASDFEQGFGTGTEQQAVEELLVLQGEGCQPMREREDQVGVRGGQDFPAARLNPTVAGVGLALGAVSIAAAVVRDDAMPAAGALIQVPTQDGGATALDRRQDLALLAG